MSVSNVHNNQANVRNKTYHKSNLDLNNIQFHKLNLGHLKKLKLVENMHEVLNHELSDALEKKVLNNEQSDKIVCFNETILEGEYWQQSFDKMQEQYLSRNNSLSVQ